MMKKSSWCFVIGVIFIFIHIIARDPTLENLRAILTNYVIWHYIKKVDKFCNLIGSFLLFLSAIFILKAPITRYGWFFIGEHFVQYARYCFSIMLMIIAIISVIIPPSKLLAGLIGIVYSGTCFIIFFTWIQEAHQLQRKGIYIPLIKIFAMWFVLICSYIMFIISLIVIIG